MTLSNLKKELQQLKNPEKAKILSNFFKTGKGQYGEGDIFLGIPVGDSRAITKKYKDIQFSDIKKLLLSRIHEERLVALLILVDNYQKTFDKKIIDFYLSHTKYVNNWDLVDLTAPKLLGPYLLDKDRSVLYKLANSSDLWEKRISVISTFVFIRNGEFEDTFKISEILLKDKHDLIHKAVGWMLREVGKKDQKEEERFLKKYYKKMPRTMLRYAIERFDEDKRKFYMKK
ncbi:MAG: DNA alkylation repair protein [Candidatus Woesearchaeota archaeon]